MLLTCLVILLAGTVAIGAAYAAGRRAARKETLPWRQIFQLVDHRARCLAHPPPRIERELGGVLPIPPVAWPILLAPRRPLDRRGTGAGRAQ
jgi:hypothetical protein